VRCASGDYDYRMRIDNWQKRCRLSGATERPTQGPLSIIIGTVHAAASFSVG